MVLVASKAVSSISASGKSEQSGLFVAAAFKRLTANLTQNEE